MLKIIAKDTTPPFGFRYVDPDTSFPFVADYLQQLVEKVRAHRQANKLAVPENLSDVVENFICHNCPPGICRSPDGEKYTGGRSRESVENITNATLRVARSRQFVSKEEAERRAAICSSCSENSPRRHCGSCRGTNNIIKEILGNRSTQNDPHLGVCDSLGVFLKAFVHLAGKANSSKGELPDNCWLKGKA